MLGALAPTTSSQQAQPRLLILHDVPDDGFAYVGNPNQFAFLVLTEEGKTTVHKNGKIVVTQNGVKLYETLGGSQGTSTAHDYDAFNSFMIAFPVEGPYTVHAEVPYAAGLKLSADFQGTVHAIPSPVKAALQVVAPSAMASAMVGAPVNFEFKVVDEAGTLLPHTDALFEVRRADSQFLLFRTHTHTHDAPMKLTYRFAEQGDYTIRIVGYTAYPSLDTPGFAPVSQTLRVRAMGSATPGAPMVSPPSTTAAPATGKYVLATTYDPETTVTPFGNIRLNTLVLDAETRLPVAHVNFEATLTDPRGAIVFQSMSLHEYDGNLEVVTQNSAPGDYRLRVMASQGDWSAYTDLNFRVVPVSGAYGAGPTIIKATGLDKLVSGTPSKIEFAAQTLAGTPHQHSEIELHVNAGTTLGAPLLLNKLHTHMDGKFSVEVVFPEAGDYTLLLDAETVHGDPTPAYYYDRLGNSLLVPVKVAPGVPLPNVPALEVPAAPLEDEGAGIPGPGLFLAVLAAVGAILLGRRTR